MAVRFSSLEARGTALTNAVRSMLELPDYRVQAQRVRGLFARADGAAGAANAIRRYLAERTDGATRAAA
jgi:UDP:flavonoid glycosyltransferase YjiC (YdhE family)